MPKGHHTTISSPLLLLVFGNGERGWPEPDGDSEIGGDVLLPALSMGCPACGVTAEVFAGVVARDPSFVRTSSAGAWSPVCSVGPSGGDSRFVDVFSFCGGFCE